MGSRRAQVVAAVAAGAVLAAVLVAVSLVGTTGEARPSGVVAGLDETIEMLDGVPQEGTLLGPEDAAVTLVEYADIQCPHCAHFARDGFPHLVWDYVRAGDLRIELRGLSFIGPDSEKALRAALAAGLQDRLWHVAELLYYAQGEPNSGWVTDDLLRAIGDAVPGLDAERMLADMGSDEVERRLAEAQAAAQEAEVPGTPYFELGRTGEATRPLAVESLSADAFRPAIDQLLGR